MFDLEKEIHRWKTSLRRSGALEDGDIAELEGHVRDEIRESIANGLGEEPAFRKATEDPADENLLSEYGKAHRPAGRAGLASSVMPALVWNTVKVTFRKIRKQKGYSFINIAGLALGLACCLLITFWVRDELSFDRFHDRSDRIFRINKRYPLGTKTETNSTTPYPLAATARSACPEIENATTYYERSATVRIGEKYFSERGVCHTDAAFFRVFSFPFKTGDAAVLERPEAAVITERTAARYFGDGNPIGRVLTFDGRKLFTVRGVIENIPANSHFQFDLFVPAAATIDSDQHENWGSHYCSTYVRLRAGADPKALESKLTALIKDRLPDEKIDLILQPLTKIRLYAENGVPAGMKYVYFFSAIAFFILAIACINFINLSTARSEKRAKEVGLRKAVGATRGQIARQFFGESTLFTLIALAAALLMVLGLRAPFKGLTGKTLTWSALGPDLLAAFAAIAVLTAILAGIYPAMVLSSFQPIHVLRGTRRRAPTGRMFRKFLVVLQFSLAAILIVGTAVVSRQIRFIRTSDPGYDSSNVVFMWMNEGIEKNYPVFRNELLQAPDILGVARASSLPGEVWSITRGVRWEGMTSTDGAAFGYLSIDPDFLETVKIKILQGRNFAPGAESDKTHVLVNECAARIMGMKDPVGRSFSPGPDSAWTIIGVVRDFHSLSYQYAIEPLVIAFNPSAYGQILVRMRPGADQRKTMALVASAWKKAAPEFPFEYRLIDDRFDLNYPDELRAERLFKSFVALAVFISCLGLLGLASFTAEQKTKEVGVRKILGASVPQIMVLLAGEFLKWVFLANLIAAPAAYLLMKGWLRNFAYRTDFGPLLFLEAAILSLGIALLTVSAQAVKAARANPAASLRHE